jgi:hypothetical protein
MSPLDSGDLLVEVDAPERPGLRVEVAGDQRFVIRQGDNDVLFAIVETAHDGVDVLLTGDYASPIPPLRAAQARDLAGRWPYHLVPMLADAPDGPLHRARWILRAEPGGGAARPEAATRLITADPAGRLDWFDFGSPWDIVPLRPMSPADAPRVKAYRRQAREGVLPPVLCWAVSGLAALVIVDGHDRLAAAFAEEIRPPLLKLERTHEVPERDEQRGQVIDGYVELVRRHVMATTAAGRGLARALRSIDTDPARTRAWPYQGGVAAWDAAVRAADPEWLARIRPDD